MGSKHSHARLCAVTCVVMMAAGCGEAGTTGAPTTGDIAVQSSALVNGAGVASDTLGTVEISSINPTAGSPTICSGTMLSPTWVLTAHHCVTKGGAVTGGVEVFPAGLHVKTNDGQVATIVQIVRHPSLDVALLQLRTPLEAPGATAPFTTRLFRGSSASLVGQSLLCEGWGANNLNGSGGGTLRSATLPIAAGSAAQTYLVNSNGSGQGQFKGDDGGACFITESGQMKITGVCGVPSTTSASCQHTGADAFRSWATGIIGTGASPASPSGYERQDGVTSMVYRNADNGDPTELCFGPLCGTGWSRADFHTIFGAPTATNMLSGYARADGRSAFVWRGAADNHIREASFLGGWSIGDLTAASSATEAAAGDPSAYVRTDMAGSVVYQGTDGHIHEADLTFSPLNWHDSDISAAASAPTGTNPVGFVRADGINAVVYVSGASVIELDFLPTSGTPPDQFMCPSVSQHWVMTNVSASTFVPSGQTLPPPVGPVRPYTRSDGITAIAYEGNNSHLIELEFGALGWSFADLSALTGTGGTFAPPFPFVREDGTSAILYLTGGGDLAEMELSSTEWIFNGNGWGNVDLTTTTSSVKPFLFGTNGPIAMGFVRGDGVTEVAFQGLNKHFYGITHTSSGWARDTSTSSTGDLTPGGE